MLTGTLFAGLAVALALLVAIYRKLAALPVANLAQAARARTEAQAQALAALQEAATAEVAAITATIRAHEERAAARHRDEVAAMEVRARMAERRAADAVSVLDAASILVRELRQSLDELLRLVPVAGKSCSDTAPH
jgi:hypothetical protein